MLGARRVRGRYELVDVTEALGDDALATPGVWGAWPVPPPGSGRSCRYLRVRLTENTGMGGEVSGWRLRLSNLEFYGVLSTRKS